MIDSPRAPSIWGDAALALTLFAIDPAGAGGVVLRARPGPVRDLWLAQLAQALPRGAPWRRVPLHIADGRLLGGLDLAATLSSGRPVAERGVLADANGGVAVLAMAERVSAATAARLAAVMDAGEVAIERDGCALRSPARFGLVALDEGMDDDETVAPSLRDRCALVLDLHGARGREPVRFPDADSIAAASTLLPEVAVDASIIEALCAAAQALGIDSARAVLLALRVARAAAAWDGRVAVTVEDAALAARLVLAPRATQLPPAADDASNAAEVTPDENVESAPRPNADMAATEGEATADPTPPVDHGGMLDDVVVAAATAAIPPQLLAQLQMLAAGVGRQAPAGRAGVARESARRGRPNGTRPGQLHAGARLAVVDTLRAAAPWQRLRALEPRADAGGKARIQIRREDFRITRYAQRSQTTTIFVVDASGSSALHRLAEAKGAVELLLADCYVRRDQVALIAFRGRSAELLLPPTRSLVRAKRCLAGLPGGGGTPLATAITVAGELALATRRRGATPVVVFLTDGRANVARDGIGGRIRAEDEALQAARSLRASGETVLLVDTSREPQVSAQRLAEAMRARYLPLPQGGGASISGVVRAITHSANPAERPASR